VPPICYIKTPHFPNLQKYRIALVLSLSKNISRGSETPQTLATTPREEWSYIFLTLKEIANISLQNIFLRGKNLLRPVRANVYVWLYHKHWEIYILLYRQEYQMSKRYVLEVQEGDDGEVFVQFPDELLEEAGWREGDYLEYSEDIDGTIMLKKVDEE